MLLSVAHREGRLEPFRSHLTLNRAQEGLQLCKYLCVCAWMRVCACVCVCVHTHLVCISFAVFMSFIYVNNMFFSPHWGQERRAFLTLHPYHYILVWNSSLLQIHLTSTLLRHVRGNNDTGRLLIGSFRPRRNFCWFVRLLSHDLSHDLSPF